MPACLLSRFSRVQLCATLWTLARQVLLSMAILQARMLEWIAMPSSQGFSQPRDRTHVSYVSCLGRWVLYHKATCGEPCNLGEASPDPRGRRG